MSSTGGDQGAEAERRRKMLQAAESRLVVQASMQAKRSGQLPAGRDTTASEMITAIVVIVVLIATLAIALKFGN